MLQTYTRGHKVIRTSHLTAGKGTEDYVKCKGID